MERPFISLISKVTAPSSTVVSHTLVVPLNGLGAFWRERLCVTVCAITKKHISDRRENAKNLFIMFKINEDAKIRILMEPQKP